MTTTTSTLAEVLTVHQRREDLVCVCACGWRPEPEAGNDWTSLHVAHVVDAVAANGPEADAAGCRCDGASYEVKRHPFLTHPDCPVHRAT